MCGDPHSRTPTVDSGDLIAIIHPAASLSEAFFGGRLHLSNRHAGVTVSTLSCREGSISSHSDARFNSEATTPPETMSIRIHKLGRPLLLSNAEESNPVMHSFPVSACDTSSAGRRLNFGVGGDGVVGRTVSIINGSDTVLGEGVIGWS